MFLVTLTFYLGTHKPAWLGKLAVPLFVSRRLAKEKLPLGSADSMAWSFCARYEKKQTPGCPHRRCNNCPRYAMRWRAEVLERIAA